MSNNNEVSLHFMQDYTTANVHRSKINEAPYNPRAIGDKEYKDLKRSLKKIGLRETLVWNKQSGNLVSGHQRLRVLDDEWKRKFDDSLDYSLTVVVIDVGQKEEIELNIAFNNPRLMGRYDISKMNEILSSSEMPDIDLQVAGFTDDDLQMFGVELDIENIEDEAVNEAISNFEDVKTEKANSVSPEEKQKRKETVKDIKAKSRENKLDTYFTVTFSDQDAKRAFMKKIGEPENALFVKGEIFDKKHFSE